MESKKNLSPIQKRLYDLADALGISNREFSRSIGKSASYLPTLANDISLNVAVKILTVYPQVNIVWLVTGEGEMFLTKPMVPDLQDYILKENSRLNSENKELIEEIGRLKERISQLKKEVVHLDIAAESADAGSYGLAK